MITKVLLSAAIALGAAVGVAAPAMADPVTSSTTCTCQPPAEKVGPAVPSPEQFTQGIQKAFSDLQARQGQR